MIHPNAPKCFFLELALKLDAQEKYWNSLISINLDNRNQKVGGLY
jgi:hypothetical protein